MDAEKQQRIIHFLVQRLAKLHMEDLVHKEFLRELKEDKGRVGILDDLARIRGSEKIQEAHHNYFTSLDSLIYGKELPDQALQELIRRLGSDESKPN